MASTGVTVFGSVVADTRLVTEAPARPGTSNPATSRERSGGVGRNVAMALARMGLAIRLSSRVGEDAAGQALVDELRAAGIDTGGIESSARHPTARYWAVLEPSGELVIGLADMAVFAEHGAAAVEQVAARPAAAWFIDCNLPAATLALLLDHPKRPALVAADTVSAAKALRLRGHLARLDLLFTNAAEAAALVGPGPPAELARRLVAQGVGAVVLGQGAAGLVLADATGVHALDALAVPVVDVTGAGDALAAGVLAARLAGLELAAACRIGRLAAALAVGSDAAVPQDFGIPVLRDLALRLDSVAHVQLARL